MRIFESFGIIMMRVIDDELSVLLVERKDSFAFLQYNKPRRTYTETEKIDLLKRMCIQEAKIVRPEDGATFTQYKYREFGFPKGRRLHRNEKDIDCAFRELLEETGYTREDCKIISYNYKYCDGSLGSDKNMYKNKYFLVQLLDETKEPLICPREINRADFYTKEESLDLVRDYDLQKRKIIEDVFTWYKIYYNNSKVDVI